MHPLNSPDLASGYHLFRSLQNVFNGVNLISKEACENYLSRFFDQKFQKFYIDGIMTLLEKWQKIIDQNILGLIRFVNLKQFKKCVSIMLQFVKRLFP